MTRRPPDAAGTHPPAATARPAGTVGATALVRIAGLPGALWASAGNEPLFARAADLAERGDLHTARARALGDLLGTDVVPHPRLADPARGAVLALRRRLHAGTAPGPADLPVLTTVADVAPSLADALAELADRATDLAAARDEFAAAVATDRARVGRLALDLLHRDPVLRTHLGTTAPRIAADFPRRAAAGEPWHGKRLRKYTGYVWRVVARAAAKTTPRDWLGQLAAVPVPVLPAPGPAAAGDSLFVPPARAGAGATSSMENVHLLWARLRDAGPTAAGPDGLLALTPLHCPTSTGVLRCAVVDTGPRGSRLRRIELRRTPVLDAVLALLSPGPRPFAEVEALIAARLASPAHGTPEGRRRVTTALRGFLQHLLRLGVLQRCAAPEQRRTHWIPAARLHPPQHTLDDRPAPVTAAAPDARDGTGPRPADTAPPHQEATWFVDSYRALDARLDALALARITRGLRLATRLAALRAEDRPPTAPTGTTPQPHPGPADIGPEPRSVADLLTAPPADPSAEADHPATATTRRRYEGWHPARTSGSGYAHLLAHLAAHLDDERIDLDGPLLDACHAPPAAPELLAAWPADCLLRPLDAEGPVAVLETASPAGVLDARFAEALHALHAGQGGYRPPAAYRAFLSALERAADVRFVEVLVPPLDARAANAVRRPVLTDWSTGDANTSLYYGSYGGGCGAATSRPSDGSASRPVHHLPLDRLTLRSDGHHLIAEVDGARVFPVHHATRSPAPPYDRLTRLLMAAAHPATRHVVQLGSLIGAFPTADRVPRLSVGGDLVVSPAAWRVPVAELWEPGAREADKVTALAVLRRTRQLPRFCFARPAPGAKPVPVDLAALPALHVLERLRAAAPDGALIVEEALPAPGRSPVRDAVHGGAPVAAQVQLRTPHDAHPEELAARAAAALRHWSAPNPPRPRPQTTPDAPPQGRPPGRNRTPRKGGQSCPQPSN
ncbi:lantibiotic dehydratase [Streptomyces lunalinharesii]|uniref:Lantibiotic dehydratase N-terminal domain-containing protein n=1 Tax=Streptomyces lunalinharesii TaxID=333384 RepID=A0ABP6E7P1_9ACTN